jgi:hypothetical protein
MIGPGPALVRQAHPGPMIGQVERRAGEDHGDGARRVEAEEPDAGIASLPCAHRCVRSSRGNSRPGRTTAGPPAGRRSW